jgi:hypothetical protein
MESGHNLPKRPSCQGSFMKEDDEFIKAFKEGHRCDFCEQDDMCIAKIVLHPALKLKGQSLCLSGYIAAHKCMKCCKED